jgi:predicted RNase H-like HicB family nuclease
MDVSYCSIIKRKDDGCFVACVPDLPGVQAAAVTEGDVLRQIASLARARMRDMLQDGKDLPPARPMDQIPRSGEAREYRRVLLIIGVASSR